MLCPDGNAVITCSQPAVANGRLAVTRAPRARLDREMVRSWRAIGRVQGIDRRNAQIENWTLQDIRRTVRTRLSALRVPEQIAELVIGHAKRGLIRVYDQHKYADEVREALALWNAKLETIVNPPIAPNVVSLRGAS